MSNITKAEGVRYTMLEGGTITVTYDRDNGPWSLAFEFTDEALNFTETAENVPAWMAVVKTHCGWPAACVTF